MVVLFLSLLVVVAKFGELVNGDEAAAGAGAGDATGLDGVAAPFLACSMAWHLLV